MILKLTHVRKFVAEDTRIGVLEDGHGFQLFTLDPLSGIPAGEYKLIPYRSPDHGQTWCFHNRGLGIYAGAGAGYPKPAGDGNHDYVEFHVGNYRRDTEDCNLVGTRWDGTNWIEDSATAMDRLIAHLGEMSRGHKVIVDDGYGD